MKKWNFWKNDLEGKSLGYKIGYACGSICILSLVILLASFVVIGSAKLIFWLLTI